ncbi:hypothetical protein GCM10009118_23840 [Wandonia haliotis]|uniref:Uncharacterized protein n=1 Tax=Wandonia haliotis TaxID=574963 RepID=A0ABN1MSK5_9FLAO
MRNKIVLIIGIIFSLFGLSGANYSGCIKTHLIEFNLGEPDVFKVVPQDLGKMYPSLVIEDWKINEDDYIVVKSRAKNAIDETLSEYYILLGVMENDNNGHIVDTLKILTEEQLLKLKFSKNNSLVVKTQNSTIGKAYLFSDSRSSY